MEPQSESCAVPESRCQGTCCQNRSCEVVGTRTIGASPTTNDTRLLLHVSVSRSEEAVGMPNHIFLRDAIAGGLPNSGLQTIDVLILRIEFCSLSH